MDYIKELLKEKYIQELLESNNLDGVYSYCLTEERGKLTQFLLNNEIEPLDYVSQIYPSMYACTDITGIFVPENIKDIGNNAFAACMELEQVQLPLGLNYIENSMFISCTFLETVNIPSTVQGVGTRAFKECASLKEIILPEGLQCIEKAAFAFCLDLNKIYIPDSCVDIDETAFLKCKYLEIHCNKNSYAHEYAVKNNIKFKLVN